MNGTSVHVLGFFAFVLGERNYCLIGSQIATVHLQADARGCSLSTHVGWWSPANACGDWGRLRCPLASVCGKINIMLLNVEEGVPPPHLSNGLWVRTFKVCFVGSLAPDFVRKGWVLPGFYNFLGMPLLIYLLKLKISFSFETTTFYKHGHDSYSYNNMCTLSCMRSNYYFHVPYCQGCSS